MFHVKHKKVLKKHKIKEKIKDVGYEACKKQSRIGKGKY